MGSGQEIEEVSIERLRFGLSPREEFCDAHHVAALAEVIDDVPPILVQAHSMRVIDGVHRVHAALSLGRVTIRAVMFEGNEADAEIEAVRRNVAHGKPLSLAERESAAERILALVPDWSDRRIALVTGLAPKTVARLRSRATADSAQSRARLGRDGRLRPVDPAELRHRVAEALRAEPAASNRAIALRTGASQATVRDVRDRLRKGMSEVPPGPAARRNRRRASPASTPPVSPVPVESGEPTLPDAVSADFSAWFEPRRIDDGDWERFVTSIAISRVYEVADMCRRLSTSWRAFATALEDRARAHRRSAGSSSRDEEAG
jgi:ParB-like chromosome segregation protein Spo0J